MLNGELTPRSNLIGELTGGVFYGTNDYEELINKPSINGVELKGNKTTSDLGINIPTELSELTNDVGFITSADVPTKTSDLTNDSGYITSADVSAVGISGDYDDLTNKPTIPTLTSQLTNDSGFITNASVPTMTSQLFNDSGFITSSDIPTDVSAFTNDAGYITSSDIPTDVSAFTNDAGYITSADIPTDVSAFNNDAGYISNSDLMTATASGSIATFNNGGDDIPVSEFECEIVAQQASGTPSPVSPLPITGFSQADITVTDNDQITNLYTVAFGQTIYGGRLIYKKGQWSIEESIKGHKLNELTWVYNGTLQCFLNIGNTEIDRNIDDSHYLSDLKCSCFQTDSVTNTIYQRNNYRIASNPTGDIFISCSDYTNVTDFINAFGNETIIYPLATPIIIPITSSTRVKTISGDNNIYSNTGDCELKYFTNKADSLAELIKAFVV